VTGSSLFIYRHCIVSLVSDKVSNAVINEKTKLSDLPSLIADRSHSLFGHICHLPENTPASQVLQLSIEAHTYSPMLLSAADWKRPPCVVHEKHGCNKWKKTLACLLVLHRSQAKIVRCGVCYDPQLVNCTSD